MKLDILLVTLVWVCFSSNSAYKASWDPEILDGSNWMRDNLELLGKRTLKQICIPGSHDAGMSEFRPGTTLAHPCNVQTQTNPIKYQLELGVRFLDVRPAIGNGGLFLTGHYSRIAGGTWQGGNGQSIQSIVDDINAFTKAHNELIIVRLSHTLNTEVGNNSYRKFTQSEWERLFQILDKTNHLYQNSDGNVYLPSLSLNHFTDFGKRAAVIYVIRDPKSGVDMTGRLGKGYFNQTSMNMYHKYSKTNKLSTMFGDQMQKMKEYSRSSYFMLSWTLTQGGKKAAFCRINLTKSIRELADEANSNLRMILSEISQLSYPNVLYVDDIKSIDVTSVAMEINSKLKF
ncbi:uncharacterized protein [Halyomorpha halys]|uniref:uncharacterized protein n=1 Tax=Halyomorpha halys TaxID=286706 RepID=UPI0006D4D2F0|nr:uncharacterized protein LOC106687066 [Halyomorpha halys]